MTSVAAFNQRLADLSRALEDIRIQVRGSGSGADRARTGMLERLGHMNARMAKAQLTLSQAAQLMQQSDEQAPGISAAAQVKPATSTGISPQAVPTTSGTAGQDPFSGPSQISQPSTAPTSDVKGILEAALLGWTTGDTPVITSASPASAAVPPNTTPATTSTPAAPLLTTPAGPASNSRLSARSASVASEDSATRKQAWLADFESPAHSQPATKPLEQPQKQLADAHPGESWGPKPGAKEAVQPSAATLPSAPPASTTSDQLAPATTVGQPVAAVATAPVTTSAASASILDFTGDAPVPVSETLASIARRRSTRPVPHPTVIQVSEPPSPLPGAPEVLFPEPALPPPAPMLPVDKAMLSLSLGSMATAPLSEPLASESEAGDEVVTPRSQAETPVSSIGELRFSEAETGQPAVSTSTNSAAARVLAAASQRASISIEPVTPLTPPPPPPDTPSAETGIHDRIFWTGSGRHLISATPKSTSVDATATANQADAPTSRPSSFEHAKDDLVPAVNALGPNTRAVEGQDNIEQSYALQSDPLDPAHQPGATETDQSTAKPTLKPGSRSSATQLHIVTPGETDDSEA